MVTKERLINFVAVAATAYILWSASELLQATFLPQTNWAAGIDIFYLPSGVRLLLLLVGGASAAVGIALANLSTAGPEFGLGNPAVIIATAFYTAFAPLFGLWVTMRMLGVERSLKNLSTWHLPWLCLGMALGSSVLHMIYLDGLRGSLSWDTAGNILTMALGDFVGSLVVVYAAWMLIKLYRAVPR